MYQDIERRLEKYAHFLPVDRAKRVVVRTPKEENQK
jgi:hypothetical protein